MSEITSGLLLVVMDMVGDAFLLFSRKKKRENVLTFST